MSTAVDAERMQRFLEFSAAVTAFTVYELLGTGVAAAYLEAADRGAGSTVTDSLLEAFADAGVQANRYGEPSSLEDLLRRDIFSDPTLGPVARNVIKMWYVGIWYALPPHWSQANGLAAPTVTVSATAYTEGLLWPAIGANPPGAKPPGFASWVAPPRIPARSSRADA